MKSDIMKKIIDYLGEQKIRVTPQRVEIVKELIAFKEYNAHPTPDEIYHQVKDKLPGISLATVYNNLKMLVRHGVVEELRHGEKVSRYEIKTGEHYHVTCMKCGAVRDFHYPRMEEIEEFAHKYSYFTISGHHLQFYGTCQLCQKERQQQKKGFNMLADYK